MLENTSVIKRPVLCKNNQVLVGFDADLYKKTLDT
jgi:arsenate reductase-like glutaredoxin family protein